MHDIVLVNTELMNFIHSFCDTKTILSKYRIWLLPYEHDISLTLLITAWVFIPSLSSTLMYFCTYLFFYLAIYMGFKLNLINYFTKRFNI